MCRFVAYIGEKPILIGELLVKPGNSLIKQSKNATKDQYKVNADGFGMAWYDFKIINNPAVFRSIQPAWNDSNLIDLAKIIESKCFIGHIRSSTIGDITKSNCHPFCYKDYTMVHNGAIDGFDNIRRSLMAELSDELFLEIKGNTDSECLFFLIMQYVYVKEMSLNEAIKEAFRWVDNAQGEEDSSRLNIVITNGKEMIATRFVTKEHKALSLNYSKYDDESVVIASEDLDDHLYKWHEVPVNHYVQIKNGGKDLKIASFSDIK
jgi:ergothioneine biosynthesis protein EgtC